MREEELQSVKERTEQLQEPESEKVFVIRLLKANPERKLRVCEKHAMRRHSDLAVKPIAC